MPLVLATGRGPDLEANPESLLAIGGSGGFVEWYGRIFYSSLFLACFACAAWLFLPYEIWGRVWFVVTSDGLGTRRGLIIMTRCIISVSSRACYPPA